MTMTVFFGAVAGTKTVTFTTHKKPIKVVAELQTAAVGYDKAQDTPLRQALQVVTPDRPEVRPAARLMMIVPLPNGKAKLASAWEQLRELVRKGIAQFATPRLRDSEGYGRYVTDEVTVRFKKPPKKPELAAFTKQYNLSVIRQSIGSKETYLMKTSEPDWEQVLKHTSTMDADVRVEFASPNFLSEMRRG
jgi:hypothetical protein